MLKRLGPAVLFSLMAASGSYAQTAGQSVTGFLLAQGSTYGSFTCPSSATSPCFVQYGPSIPTTGGGGSDTPVSIDQTTPGTTNGVQTNSGSVTANTSTQAISGTTKVQFNAETYDSNAVCNTTSTFVCTPSKPGLYFFTCQVTVTAATGPALNGALIEPEIFINGSTLIALASTNASVALQTTPSNYLQISSIWSMNGSTDTVECDVNSSSTTPVIQPAVYGTYLIGYYLGPS